MRRNDPCRRGICPGRTSNAELRTPNVERRTPNAERETAMITAGRGAKIFLRGVCGNVRIAR
jgi:hypothetical protein